MRKKIRPISLFLSAPKAGVSETLVIRERPTERDKSYSLPLTMDSPMLHLTDPHNSPFYRKLGPAGLRDTLRVMDFQANHVYESHLGT